MHNLVLYFEIAEVVFLKSAQSEIVEVIVVSNLGLVENQRAYLSLGVVIGKLDVVLVEGIVVAAVGKERRDGFDRLGPIPVRNTEC